MKIRRETEEDIANALLTGVGKFLFTLGSLAVLFAAGFLVFYFSRFSSGQETVEAAKQAKSMLGTFGQVMLIGSIASAAGACMLYWSEEVLAPLLLGIGASLYFSPMFLPQIFSANAVMDIDIPGLALQRLQSGGLVFGLIGLGALAFDIQDRIRNRIKYGSKADTIKFGKGMKEEDDVQLQFLGKCWQMAYCRKFVRERCPIYHAKRTCWKERVGCMCEEKVIANALTGGAIPKDMVAAAKYIPYNTTLPPEAKAERCRQCVIYNERQRQKYKVAMPVTAITVLASYALLREPIKEAVSGLARTTDRFLGNATVAREGAEGVLIRANDSGFLVMQEVLAAGIMVMILAYCFKVVEFAIFKLKI